MRKLLCFAILMLSLLSYNAAADTLAKAPVSPMAEELKTEFQNFNFQLTNAQNGIFNYSGSHEGIRINFSADSEKIVELNMMLDKDTMKQKSKEIIRLADRFLPQKIADKEKAPQVLIENLCDMNVKEDINSFKIDNLVVSVKCSNGMYYIVMK